MPHQSRRNPGPPSLVPHRTLTTPPQAQLDSKVERVRKECFSLSFRPMTMNLHEQAQNLPANPIPLLGRFHPFLGSVKCVSQKEACTDPQGDLCHSSGSPMNASLMCGCGEEALIVQVGCGHRDFPWEAPWWTSDHRVRVLKSNSGNLHSAVSS